MIFSLFGDPSLKVPTKARLVDDGIGNPPTAFSGTRCRNGHSPTRRAGSARP